MMVRKHFLPMSFLTKQGIASKGAGPLHAIDISEWCIAMIITGQNSGVVRYCCLHTDLIETLPPVHWPFTSEGH